MRIKKEDVYLALERAAENIRSAAGNDPFVSRKDIRNKLKTLEGLERDLTDIFYRFMDNRDYRPGARITEADIKDTVAYSKEHLIDNYDLNNNGLSKSEIEKMSTTGKLAVQFSKYLKRAGASEGAKTFKELEARLGWMSEGLYFDYFGSEAAIEMKVFTKETNLESLTRESFAEALDLDQNDFFEVIERFETNLDDFYDAFISTDEFIAGNGGVQAKELIQFMKNNLKEIAVIILGDDGRSTSEHPTYWVGLWKNGEIAGFLTQVIWT